MTPTDYEKAVLQQIRTDWPPPRFVVRHNIRITGKKSKARRQIDIGVFEAGHSKPFMIVEAKRHKRPIDVGKAGSAIALVQDVGGIPAVMVSTSGFSVAADNHLGAEGIGTMTITLTEAQGLRWIPLVEEKFAVDREFRSVSGDLVEALRNGNADPFIDADIPYEEWLAVIAVGRSLFPESSARVLKSLQESTMTTPRDTMRLSCSMKPERSKPPMSMQSSIANAIPRFYSFFMSFGRQPYSARGGRPAMNRPKIGRRLSDPAERIMVVVFRLVRSG